MNEAEYNDKLKVREQLSTADRIRVLEYEFVKLTERIKTLETPVPPPTTDHPPLEKTSL